MKWMQLLDGYASGLDETRIVNAKDLAKTGSISIEKLEPGAVMGIINTHNVALGSSAEDPNVFVAKCTCEDRQYRGGACKHMIAMAAIADNRRIIPTPTDPGYDVHSVILSLRKSYGNVPSASIVYAGLVLLERLTLDPALAAALQVVMAKAKVVSIEDAVDAAVRYAQGAPEGLLELMLPKPEASTPEPEAE